MPCCPVRADDDPDSGGPRHLHVFLDESGGTDAANDTFLVAAVAIAPRDAACLVRTYRKAARTSGEVQGHRLGRRQRGIFLDLLAREAAAAAVVACRRAESLGGWAMSALPEPGARCTFRDTGVAMSLSMNIPSGQRLTVSAIG